ncbi:hypothetical protein [Pedobacter sp. KLB.chiD]|uniref:hypothetical protein n=1 Tax=Pedobacter sp. KLB.chiD TaxID=3387402 RepID=UPI00399BDC25
MNIELSYLYQIIDSITNKSIAFAPEDNSESDILNEVNSLKQKIHSYVPESKCGLQDFIHLQLTSIGRMINQIEDVLKQGIESEDHRKLLEVMLTSLEGLLNYLWKYYPLEFDLSIQPSTSAIEKYQQENQQKIDAAIHYINYLEISQELKGIIKDTLYLKLSGTTTYKWISFNLELIDYLYDNNDTQLSEEAIIGRLISRQFNHPRFYEFCHTVVIEKLNSLSAISDHYRELVYMRKSLIQIPEIAVSLYSPFSEAIKDSLLKLFDSELEFLKELDFINTELVNSGLLDSTYKVSLSVKQLAFYIFLNVEAGIIIEQKATRIHQYVISHVSTAEKPEISEKSFSNGYYVHNPEDIRRVSEKLARMLAIAQEKY